MLPIERKLLSLWSMDYKSVYLIYVCTTDLLWYLSWYLSYELSVSIHLWRSRKRNVVIYIGMVIYHKKQSYGFYRKMDTTGYNLKKGLLVSERQVLHF